MNQTSPKKVCASCGQAFTLRLNGNPLYDSFALRRKVCYDCSNRETDQEETAEQAEEAAKLQRWLKIVGLPARFERETFALWAERKWAATQPKRAVQEWAEGFPERPVGYRSLVLHSDEPGTGKTTLAACAVNAIIERHRFKASIRYETGPSLGLRVRATYNRTEGGESEEDVYVAFSAVKLLVLDDVGDPDKEPSSEHTRRVYFHLIDKRYQAGLPILLVTNSQGPRLENIIGRYAFDRLMEMTDGRIVHVSGKTRAQRLRP